MGLAEFGYFWTVFSHLMNERISETRCQAVANTDGVLSLPMGKECEEEQKETEKEGWRHLCSKMLIHPKDAEVLLRCPSPSSWNTFPNNHSSEELFLFKPQPLGASL